MITIKARSIAFVILSFALSVCCDNQNSRVKILDAFESASGWKIIASDAATLDTTITDGYAGRCIRLDFDFTLGTGYCGIQKQFPLKFPSNFEFSFYLKADAPVNNLEFKLVDRSGDNVWWSIQRNFEFPRTWQKITVKKRYIDFAWGPIEDHALRSCDKIEFMISSTTGGKGSVYIDEFKFQETEVLGKSSRPALDASSNPEDIGLIIDRNDSTSWRSEAQPDSQEIVIDLKRNSEYGGLVIDWDALDYAKIYSIMISHDRQSWESAYQVSQGKGGRSYIYLRDQDSRYIQLKLTESSRKAGYAIRELVIKDSGFSETPEAFFTAIAADHPRGFYPKYLHREQSYWTLTGVSGDKKEALINEEGMVEVDKSSFSIEPFIYHDGQFITWDKVRTRQSLEKDYLPIPSVIWTSDDVQLTTTLFADGEQDHSILYLNYTMTNTGNHQNQGNFFLAIRPFQVNPPWQFLNVQGGVSKIKSIRYTGDAIHVNGIKTVLPLTKPNGFGAVEFDQGDIIDYISRNELPGQRIVEDHFGFASGALSFGYRLAPGESQSFFVAIPFYDDVPVLKKPVEIDMKNRINTVSQYWEERLNKVRFQLPSSANPFLNTLRSTIAYILINQDHAGIQAGSRSYERSLIRDGSMTSSALLKFGIQQEVKDFLSWYSRSQYTNGKVPCVVDFRGPDPVPENDSHGQLIYGIYQYFLFTRDTTFLRDRFDNVRRAVEYMDYLVSQRTTDVYAQGNDELRVYYGLVPESISHEGYSAKPMHSYWDDFWTLKGYKDAVGIAEILGERIFADRFCSSRDAFSRNLYTSISLAVKNRNIDYLPGCVELGDFDATSTSIAVHPCGELANLPDSLADNTFDRYYQFFTERKKPTTEWLNYTPYELRIVATFLLRNEFERAHALLDFFFSDQRPPGWNHWAEVVWHDPSHPAYIGDMPHTWVGSEFINSVRLMFACEDEIAQSLIICTGLYPEWIDAPGGMKVDNLPTYYGTINYSIFQSDGSYRLTLTGDLQIPAGNIKIQNWRPSPPVRLMVNGKPSSLYDEKYITITEFPASIDITY